MSALNPRDRIFLALPGGLDAISWSSYLAEVVQDLDLYPIHYTGLDPLPSGSTGSIHREAKGDLYSCRAVVAVFGVRHGNLIGHWICGELKRCMTEGISVIVYISRQLEVNVDEPVLELVLPESAKVLEIGDCEQLCGQLRADLGALLM